MSFHESLKSLRRDRGLTQHQLAKLTGIKTTHISRLEKEDADPKMSTIYKLMDALECSADSLLTDSKLNMDGILKTAFERAQSLDADGKRTIIDVIDKYCTAVGLNQFMEKEKWTLGTGKTKGMLEELDT